MKLKVTKHEPRKMVRWFVWTRWGHVQWYTAAETRKAAIKQYKEYGGQVFDPAREKLVKYKMEPI